MKLFVDTGSIKDIDAMVALGIIDGVTTNPSLLAKEPGDFRQNLKKICEIVQGPVSGEVTATDLAGMLREGHDIAKIDPHMVVKVPLTKAGIQTCKALSGEGIPVNVTLVFSAAQALLAAKAGATFVSPFVGRLDDVGTNGMDLIREIVDNAIDEALAGVCDTIVVTLHADGSASVLDNGRGIPIDMHPTEHKPGLELVLTELHAGGKFGGGGYKVSGGLHGVGVSCVNGLSKWLRLTVRKLQLAAHGGIDSRIAQEFGDAQDGGKGIVEFMGDAGNHLTHGGEALGLD